MEASEGSRRHRHPAPATALPVEHSEDEGDTGALAWEPADHLGPAARLAEGALDQVGVPAALPVFFREAQVDGQALEVLDQAGDRSGIGALPLGPEGVDAPAETTRRGEASLRVTMSSRKSAQASVDSELAAASPTRWGFPSVSMPQAHNTGSAGECSWNLKFVPSKNK